MKRGPAAIALAVAVVGIWLLLRSGADRIPPEIVAAAAPSVGRLLVVDMQGTSTPYDNAFAIAEGMMLTTCRGFRANTQAVVKLGARTASASVSRSDPKRNLCRLAVVGAGSWPLGINTAPPEPGDVAYAASTGPAGETVLAAVKVRGLLPAEGGQAIELARAVDASQAGGPLIDAQGRVIGVMATEHGFAGKNVALPAAWVMEIRNAPARR